jgi:hypothetical protein
VVPQTDTAITRVRTAEHLPWALKGEWHRQKIINMFYLNDSTNAWRDNIF